MKYLLSILCLFGFIFCETEATTNEGKKVILSDDGSWKYAKEKKIDATDLGIWKIKYYVDSFGDPTNQAYIGNKDFITGTFSNSATNNRKLKVKFLIEENSISIMLYEYGDNPVKNKESYYVYIKHNGKQVNDGKFISISNSGDRLTLRKSKSTLSRRSIESNKHLKLLMDILKEGGEVKFYIKDYSQYGTSSHYKFTIDDATGFDNIFTELEKLNK